MFFSYQIPLQSTQGSEVKSKQLSWEGGVACVRVARARAGMPAGAAADAELGVGLMMAYTALRRTRLDLDSSVLTNKWGCAVTSAYNDLYFFDPPALAWNKMTASEIGAPPPRCYFGFASTGSALYVYGGIGTPPGPGMNGSPFPTVSPSKQSCPDQASSQLLSVACTILVNKRKSAF